MLYLLTHLACFGSASEPTCNQLCESKADDHARIWLELGENAPVPWRGDMPKDVADKVYCVQEQCERNTCGDAGAILPMCDALDLSLPEEDGGTP